jgi:proton-dependent oligopeptide transporter, POT family
MDRSSSVALPLVPPPLPPPPPPPATTGSSVTSVQPQQHGPTTSSTNHHHHHNHHAAAPEDTLSLFTPVATTTPNYSTKFIETTTTTTTTLTTMHPSATSANACADVLENTMVKRGSFSTLSSTTTTPTTTTTTKSSSFFDDDLPSNVQSIEQLALLPKECLNPHNVLRPIRHIDEDLHETTYYLDPMSHAVIFILLIELLERFAFYGINYTQTSYLTGAYDHAWNAGMDAVPASSYVSVSVAVAYTTPFIGAFLADYILGDYYTILFGAIVFYVPGLLLIAFTTIPGLLGSSFNRPALATGLLALWPIGTGIVKSTVNIFGAKQFHPILQSSLIETYYVRFYMAINIGALVGGIVVPLLAQWNVTVSYFIPVMMLIVGIALFMMGSPRYIISQPKNQFHVWTLFTCFSHHKKKQKNKLSSNYYSTDDHTSAPPGGTIPLTVIMTISILTIPFNIAYSQMATTFIVQGTVMKKALGFIDAASMNNADAVAVLLFGGWVGEYMYPALARHNIKIPTTYKFAIGSGFGVLAMGWAMFVEHLIHTTYVNSGEKVSILWQAWSYILIGAGEIFAISAAYEVAFTASPPEKKVLASAVNLLCIGSIPNIFCLFLYQASEPWFRNSRGTTSITHIKDYTSAYMINYFWVLLAISLIGVIVNILPPVRKFVEGIEDLATELVKTPKTPIRPPTAARREVNRSDSNSRDHDNFHDETIPLMKAERHKQYLKYGSGPVLYKSGSFRAGAISERNLGAAAAKRKETKPLKRSVLARMYRSEPFVLTEVPHILQSREGTPVMAGALLRKTTEDFPAAVAKQTGTQERSTNREETGNKRLLGNRTHSIDC